jgi:hypothetical protein
MLLRSGGKKKAKNAIKKKITAKPKKNPHST